MATGATMAPQAKPPMTFGTMPVAGKVLILIAILGVLTGVYYFALHMPLVDEMSNAEARTTQLRTALEAAHSRSVEYFNLRQRLDQRAPLDRQNRRILPRTASQQALLQDLNRLAGLSDLAVWVEMRPEEATESFVKIPVSLRITGRYHQIAKFFYNVSRLDRAISMENIQIHEPHAQPDGVAVTVEVLATTYRQPDSDESAQTQAAPGTPGAVPAAAGPEDELVGGQAVQR